MSSWAVSLAICIWHNSVALVVDSWMAKKWMCVWPKSKHNYGNSPHKCWANDSNSEWVRQECTYFGNWIMNCAFTPINLISRNDSRDHSLLTKAMMSCWRRWISGYETEAFQDLWFSPGKRSGLVLNDSHVVSIFKYREATLSHNCGVLMPLITQSNLRRFWAYFECVLIWL